MTEAKGPSGTPKCPSWLDKDAKTAWRQLVPLLDEMGVLTKIDSNALARYCRLWSRWRTAEKFIEEKGEVYTLKDEKGNVRCVQQFPQVGISNKLAQQLTKLEQEFGMTPSARTRIQVTVSPGMPLNSKSRFFGGGIPTRDRTAGTKPAG